MSTDTTAPKPAAASDDAANGLPSESRPADDAASNGARNDVPRPPDRFGRAVPVAAALVLATVAGGAAGFLAASFLSDADSRIAALEARTAEQERALAEIRREAAGSSDLDARVVALVEDSATLAGLVDGLDGRVAGAEDELAALAARVENAVAGLDDELTAIRGLADDLRRTTADLSATDPAVLERLSDLDRALADRDGRLEALAADLAAVEARAADPLAGFAIALGQLRAVAESGEPFAEPLEAARRLAPEDVRLDAAFGVLERHAEAGIATAGAIEAEMGAVFAEAIAAEAVDEADGWFDKTLTRLEGLVSVRRTDGLSEGDGATAVAGRARALVEAGDVAAALAALDALSAPAAAVVAGWRAAAEAYVAVRSALRDLSARAAARASGAGG